MGNNTLWDGFVIRTSGSDDGNIPRTVKSNSPDVICSGNQPPEHPEDYIKPENYGNEYSNQIFANISNYFYIRAKNYSEGPKSGYLHTYWAPSNLLLLPSLWQPNNMLTSSGAEGVMIQAEKKGDIVANVDDAFTWVPTPPEKNTHYCIISQVSDSIDPNVGIPDQNFASGAAWADWLAQRGNWGWRNTVYISSNKPDHTETTDHHIQIPGKKTDPTKLYNLYVECKNVPIGWSFQFTSGTVIPNTPGQTNPVNTLTKSKTDVKDPNDNIGAHWYLPPQFNTNISLSVWFNGIAPNTDTKWKLRINEVTKDDSLFIYKHGIDFMDHPDPHPAIQEWHRFNVDALQKDMPIGKEVEIGNINFHLPK